MAKTSRVISQNVFSVASCVVPNNDNLISRNRSKRALVQMVKSAKFPGFKNPTPVKPK